jgi:putative transcriptional regulator
MDSWVALATPVRRVARESTFHKTMDWRFYARNSLDARSLIRLLSLSQAEFAIQFMLNLRTLQDWEQRRRKPEDIARTYLRVIERNPNAVKAALED